MIPNRHDEIPDPQAEQRPNRSSSQFSVRALLIATAIVAMLCFIFFTLPAWVGGLLLFITILLSLPATLAALVYGTGRTRAFAVGASAPTCIIFITLTGLLARGGPLLNLNFQSDDLGLTILCTIVISFVVASGFVAQIVRAWCLQRRDAN